MNKEELAYLKNHIIERFQKRVVTRDIFPIIRIDADEAHPANVIPILWKTCSFDASKDTTLQEVNKLVDAIATEEDKLCLSGDHAGWPALGIEGLSTKTGRSTFASTEAWPKGVFRDIVEGRKILRDNLGEVGPVLIVPNQIYASLELIAWLPPECCDHIEPRTYKNILLDQKLVKAIYPTNCLFASDGGEDSVLLYQPNQENTIISALDLTIDSYDLDGKTHVTIRESVVSHIKSPNCIVEISDVVTRGSIFTRMPATPKKNEVLHMMYDHVKNVRAWAEDLRDWADYVLPRIEREPEFTV